MTLWTFLVPLIILFVMYGSRPKDEGKPKKRIGFLLKVKKEKLIEYREIHKKVWPEMLEALSRCGWKNYSLFLRHDGMLFGYFETMFETFEQALDAMNKEPINTKWQAMMESYFEGTGHADKKMEELEQVFFLA